MTLRDVQKIISHWYEGAASDLRSARLLLAGNQLLQALFFCHLAVEKTLKAVIVKESKDHAPFLHNLVYLAGKTSMALSKNQLAFLELMNRFNIEGRYPAYQAQLRKEVTRAFAVSQYKTAEELISWCRKHS